jgi:hypothetical protein
MPIRRSQYTKDCVFDQFVEVSEGAMTDLTAPFVVRDGLGRVDCSLYGGSCVRGLCPIKANLAATIELSRRIKLSEKLELVMQTLRELSFKENDVQVIEVRKQVVELGRDIERLQTAISKRDSPG